MTLEIPDAEEEGPRQEEKGVAEDGDGWIASLTFRWTGVSKLWGVGDGTCRGVRGRAAVKGVAKSQTTRWSS